MLVIGIGRPQPDDVRGLVGRLPDVPFPDDALDEVWARTIDAEASRSSGPPPARPARERWSSLGLAAAVMVAITAALWTGGATDRRMSEAEMAELDREVREVLMLVSTALQRTEDAALEDVLRIHGEQP